PRSDPETDHAARRQRPLALHHALSHAGGRPDPRKGDRTDNRGRRSRVRRLRPTGADNRPRARQSDRAVWSEAGSLTQGVTVVGVVYWPVVQLLISRADVGT